MSGGASAISRASTITPAPAFTPAQLTARPGADWLTAGGDLTSQRFSSLNQITAANVSGLKQVWKTNLDGSGKAAKYSQEATPIVHNGVIYIPTGNNDIFALDATTGAHLWKYESKIAQNNNTVCCGWDARGLGFGEGKLFSEQLDGWLVAIDNTTGKQVWRTRNVRWQEGLTMTGAPVYYKGLVFVGMSGGEFGARGSMSAYNASDGRLAWRFYTCPMPGDIGGATWSGTEWMTCGATVWSYPAIDTTTDTMYFTTSNADPWTSRGPGQNLFSASMVALDTKTGMYRWHYQMVHHDIWDYDCPSPPMMFDTVVGGVVRHGVAEACKTGWVYDARPRHRPASPARSRRRRSRRTSSRTPGRRSRRRRVMHLLPSAQTRSSSAARHRTGSRTRSAASSRRSTRRSSWRWRRVHSAGRTGPR